MSGAAPASVTERERRARIVEAAEALLSQEGVQGLQMKELAHRSGVALATLYRYLPSKDHVLAAIAVQRHERSLQRLGGMRFEGRTAGERAADVLVREFRSVQREPEMASAMWHVTNTPDRSTSEYVEEIFRLMQQLVLAAVSQDGEAVTAEQREVLPIVVSAANGAITQWLAGILSADQARARIQAAARLFDLPPEVVRDYLTPEG